MTPAPLRKAAPDPVPALLVGRLAVDEAFAGMSVGTALVRHLLATAVEINLSVACKAVVVPALQEQTRNWSLRLGFERFDDDGLDLYLVTADIQKTDRLIGLQLAYVRATVTVSTLGGSGFCTPATPTPTRRRLDGRTCAAPMFHATVGVTR